MKFVATISTSTPPNFYNNIQEVLIQAHSIEAAAEQATPNSMTSPWSVLAGIKTLARHHHDWAQVKASNQTARPMRTVPRSRHDKLNADGTITFHFGRSWSRKTPMQHTMTLDGWMSLVDRCKDDFAAARSIVAQFVAGTISSPIPA